LHNTSTLLSKSYGKDEIGLPYQLWAGCFWR
jgi:hypothetical protein